EQRMRHLGEFLRKRYESLWPEKDELYVRSAYKEDFLSNPVKIYNADAQDDFMLSFDFYCPVFDKETERVLKLPDYFEWLKRYEVGAFLNELQVQMHLIESNKPFKNVRIYSSTDMVIAEILSAFGVFNNKEPLFGSTIMIEFYENHFNRLNFVRLYYLNDTYSENPHLLTLEDCIRDEVCSFKKIKKQIENYIPEDLRYECGQK
ncbi:lysosomal acid phosphatase-like protein 3, partial [Leptotrombidium deliense]